MGIDMDRLDAMQYESYESMDFEEFERSEYESEFDYADNLNAIAPVLDNDDYDIDEHAEFDVPHGIDVSDIVEEIWMDSAPAEHFTIEAGYF
jgi:hypothetical protein